MDNYYDTANRMQKSSKILFDNHDFHNSCYLAGYVIESYLKIMCFNLSNTRPPLTHNLNNLNSSALNYLASGNSSLVNHFTNNTFPNIISNWDPFAKRYSEKSSEWSSQNAKDFQNEIVKAMQVLTIVKNNITLI
ncbi:HEPN domain-containing protein [Chryseobacterium gleum]|uniref:HEPN domain-containing protein n=1 Tax=Chryseobacterium gleum TaxID=250 RepID=UPI001E4CEC8C|nr:HEPN domain-containing protein [Chryseobacterium gleum]MCD9617626.1 HEPN domain-containing protein [Chryseobacterium gleum]